MDVLFLSPAYPPEMAEYTRALAQTGARVWGVGDAPARALPEATRDALHAYLQVPALLDVTAVEGQVIAWLEGRRMDRVESLWEPLVLTAAALRPAVGAVGMSLDTVRGFRDKELMKQRIRAAGLRVPRSARASTAEEVRLAAEAIGFPLILKPIAGAGSADTHRVDDRAGLEATLQAVRHVPQVSVEEFVEGEEFTYDTLCIDGQPVFENVAQYLPRPLVARTEEWISPVIVTIRDLDRADLQPGLALGRSVLAALGMGTGFTHMEWYRTADGEVVFGEIGCRPGGAHLVDQMNYTVDADLFRGWADAVCAGRFDGPVERLYNCAIIFKRAQGTGRIHRIVGLDDYLARHHRHVVWQNLLPVGSERRNWRQTLLSDGFVVVRHPDWSTTLELAMAAASDIHLIAR